MIRKQNLLFNFILLDGSFAYSPQGMAIPLRIEFSPEITENQTRRFTANNSTDLEITISFFAFPYPDQSKVDILQNQCPEYKLYFMIT